MGTGFFFPQEPTAFVSAVNSTHNNLHGVVFKKKVTSTVFLLYKG